MDNGPNIILSTDLPSTTLARRVQKGDLRRLATGVYTTVLNLELGEVVRREWRTIAGRLVSSGVISDRSAPNAGPASGILYLVHDGATRTIQLPGLQIQIRRGKGPLSDDIALPGGLHQASLARGISENAEPSRARGSAPARRLSEEELGAWLDRISRFTSADSLVELRKQVGGMFDELQLSNTARTRIQGLFSAAAGTHIAPVASRALSLRALGLPYDTQRMDQLNTLFDALQRSAPQNQPARSLDESLLPFYEAYFSNYIEGTEFGVDEAADIIFKGDQPIDRQADAEDVRATFELVSDRGEMAHTPMAPGDFLETLRRRHEIIMRARPEKRPGEFKLRGNRAGNTLFVNPALVEGTLVEGFSRYLELETAFERAVFMHYLVSIVHPFDDGNGRLSRIMMNSELDGGRQNRIIIPTVYRDDYIGALRLLDRQDDPSILIRGLRFAHDWTASIDFLNADYVMRQLEESNAFEDEGSSARLTLAERYIYPEDVSPERTNN
jgi:hypothetical protein